MAEISKKLLDMLSDFLISEIGSKVLDGITYTMIFKTPKDKASYDRYMTIKKEVEKCGYSNDEIFRVYEVTNGFIFDMSIEIAKQITAQLAEAVAKSNGGKTPTGSIVMDMPEQRRKKDIISLARYLKSEYDNGRTQVEVALFSKNVTNKIMVNGKNTRGDAISIKYNAYAIRHWDIEILNEKFLIPAGFRVRRIQPCEILPSKTGVSFLFTLEPMQEE